MIARPPRRVLWRIVAAVALVVILIVLATAFLASSGCCGFGPGMYPSAPWGWMAMMMIGMALFGVLFIGLIVALVVWIVRALLPQYHREVDEAQSILDQRFARGEIDAQEYETRRRELVRSRQ